MTQRRRPGPITKHRRVSRPGALVFYHVSATTHPGDLGKVAFDFAKVSACYYRRPDKTHDYKPAWLETSDRAEFWDWITDRARPSARLLLVSANAMRDLTLLHHVDQLALHGFKPRHPINTARLTIISWSKADCSIVCIDHANCLPPLDLEGLDTTQAAQLLMTTWLDYLDLLDTHDLGDFKLTAGGQAITAFRHRFIQHPIQLHGKVDVDELETRACLGACYRPLFVGEAPKGLYSYVDTNSMYPWAMATFPLPWRLRAWSGRLPVETLLRKLANHAVVASVRVNTDTPDYPTRHKGRTIFPVGEYVTTLTTPDLLHAAARGRLVECLGAAWYDQAVLFQDFVSFFWRLRKQYEAEGRPDLAAMVKGWSVALYGKWGARRYITREQCEWDPLEYGHDLWIDAETGEVSEYCIMAGKVWTSSRVGLASQSFPAIMAHVAAYGRRRLFDLETMAGPHNTLFLMSDGLIVNQEGLDNLTPEIDPDTLGALRVKHQARRLVIHSDVEVVMGDLVRRPGVKAGSVEIADGVFLEHKAPGLGRLLEQADPTSYALREVVTHLERRVQTGLVGPEGWTVPLRLPE